MSVAIHDRVGGKAQILGIFLGQVLGSIELVKGMTSAGQYFTMFFMNSE